MIAQVLLWWSALVVVAVLAAIVFAGGLLLLGAAGAAVAAAVRLPELIHRRARTLHPSGDRESGSRSTRAPPGIRTPGR